MSAFTPSGSGGIPITVVTTGLTNPTVTEINILIANTEQSVVLPVSTKRFLVQVLSLGKLLVSYGSGLPPIELPRGTFLSEDDIGTSITLYVQSPATGVVARIETWI